MIRTRSAAALLVLLLSLALTGCGSSGDGTVVYGQDGGASPDATGRDGSTHVSPDARGDTGHTSLDAGTHDGHVGLADAGTSHDSATPMTDAGHVVHGDGGLPQVPVVYGQSGAVLYSVNPVTEAVTTVGFFIGCDSDVIDIALDKSSVMYATTSGGVYTVNTTTAACTLIATGTTYPNSLSFVPAGTVDPSEEALVGYEGSTYVRIDTTTGSMSNIGALGGSTYTSSGDIVSVIGGGTYLTVTGGSDCTANDCLVEVNPATGALVTHYGSVGHAQVYGLAFWAGNVYGFDNAGELFNVGFPEAGTLAITAIPIPAAPLGLSFNGAGSTTRAPRQ
jgi:hypothetical protein